MACIDLDFEESKKFLVFLACANPKVFKNYIKIFPASRPSLPAPPFQQALPYHLTSYPPGRVPQDWDSGYYDETTGHEYGLDVPYEEMTPPVSAPLPNRDRRYGYSQPMELFPDYVRFIPPTKRFPEGPPQLPRRYPPKVPPRPVVVDAAYPGDPGGRVDANTAAADGNVSGTAPIVRDVTPPGGQGQTTASGHDPARQAGAQVPKKKLSRQEQRRKGGSDRQGQGKGVSYKLSTASSPKGKGKGRGNRKRQNTHIDRRIRIYQLTRLQPRQRHTERERQVGGQETANTARTQPTNRASRSSTPTPRPRSRSIPRSRLRSPSVVSRHHSTTSPPSRPSTDYYILNSTSSLASSSNFRINMLLPKLRARLHAALRRLHPPEAVSSVRNLSHYSADGHATPVSPAGSGSGSDSGSRSSSEIGLS
ncbi:hypothetical protein V8F20_011953 [Naviculisporaceae sp. PSN 640]